MRIKISLLIFFLALSVQASELQPIGKIKYENFLVKAFHKVIECKWHLSCYRAKLGVSLTTITGTTLISDLDTIIMANDNALNNGKIENSTTTLPYITSLAGLTSAASLATVGTISSGVWNGSVINVPYGGIGASSLTQYRVLLGDGTNPLTVASTTGTAGQVFISNGAGAYPSWQSGTIDQTISYNFTGSYFGIKNLNASSTVANPLKLNDVSYNFPSSIQASSTVLMTNASGAVTWNLPDWYQLGEVVATAATSSMELTIPARKDIEILITAENASSDATTVRFNGLATSIFNSATVNTGASASTTVNANALFVTGISTNAGYHVLKISNTTAANKMGWLTSSSNGADLGGSLSGAFKWANSGQIVRVQVQRETGTNFNAGSRLIIMGSKD